MADFGKAHAFTKPMEGVYSVDPDDAGGETYCGWSRAKNPDWSGWVIIDRYKKKYSGAVLVKMLETDSKLRWLVLRDYKERYWDVIWGDRIVDQGLATQMYDTAVNKGCSVAVRFAEMSVGLGATGKMSETLLNRLNEMV